MGDDLAACRLHALDGFRDAVEIAVDRENFRAFLGKAHRGRAAVAPAGADAAGAGDDRDAVLADVRSCLCSRQMARRREAVKPLRIVDQQRLPRGFVRRDLGEDIDQHAVVGNRRRMVGMRPIGAPDAAVAELRHQLARERHRIGSKAGPAA